MRNIPPVSLAPYRPFSDIKSRSDGGDATHGYKVLTLLWGTMSLAAYFQLKRLVEQVRPGLIYVTFEMNDGSLPGGIFVDASGKPNFLQQASESPANRVGPAEVSNVQLVIKNVTILNSPSNYS